MNAQDYQTFMAEMIRRQNPNAAMTRKSQIQGALNKPLSFNSPDMPNQVGHPITMESQLGKILNVDPSGMAASGYAKDAPSKGSIEGRQRISDNQRKYAQSLRGGAAPQGRTAGPLDVYYGPNIGESLAYATNQMVGGYMEGQADKEDAAIDLDRESVLQKALDDKNAKEADRIAYRDARSGVSDTQWQAGQDAETAREEARADELAAEIKKEEEVELVRVAERIEDLEAAKAKDTLTQEQAMELERLKQGFDGGKFNTDGMNKKTIASINRINGVGRQKTAEMLVDTSRTST